MKDTSRTVALRGTQDPHEAALGRLHPGDGGRAAGRRAQPRPAQPLPAVRQRGGRGHGRRWGPCEREGGKAGGSQGVPAGTAGSTKRSKRAPQSASQERTAALLSEGAGREKGGGGNGPTHLQPSSSLRKRGGTFPRRPRRAGLPARCGSGLRSAGWPGQPLLSRAGRCLPQPTEDG